MDETLFQSDDDQEEAKRTSSQQPQIDGYECLKLLGIGTFGEVWLAKQLRTEREVAVKFLKSRPGLDWRFFEGELDRLRSLGEHPNVVTLLDADLRGQFPFFAMPHLSGGSLQDRIGQADAGEVREWLRQAASALAFSHERGMLHCDLKPSNLLLDSESRLRLVDFGQSSLVGDVSQSQLGTLGYMPPEQILEGAVPSVSWDIYALGATFYCLLSGFPPRTTDGFRERLQCLDSVRERLELYSEFLEQTVTPIWEIRPELDRDLGAIIMAMLRRDPNLRTPSARVIENDLGRAATQLPMEAYRPWQKSYLAKLWLKRNRTVAALGLAAWLAVTAPVLWAVTDVQLPVGEKPYRYDQSWTQDAPVPQRFRRDIELPPQPRFDFDKDGTVDADDYNYLLDKSVSYGAIDREFFTSEGVWGLLQLYPEGIRHLKDWDQTAGGEGDFQWSDLALVGHQHFLATAQPDTALRLLVGGLLQELEECRSNWSYGRLAYFRMGQPLLLMDSLENFPYQDVSRELLVAAADRLDAAVYPELGQVLAGLREYYITKVRNSPTINLNEPPALSFFREPILDMYGRCWNYGLEQALEGRGSSFYRGFDEFRLKEEISSAQALFHPVKAGVLYLMDFTAPLHAFVENKSFMDTRFAALKLRFRLEIFKKDHGRYPETLEELIPAYLSKLPPDPMSAGGEPFLYRGQELWSHGSRGKSDRSSHSESYSWGTDWSPRVAPYSIRRSSRH